MNKTSIIIITVCTAIVVAVVFFTLKNDPGIGDPYLTGDETISILNNDKITDFNANSSSIYLVIPVKDVNIGDEIYVEWISLDTGDEKTVQNDEFSIENTGGGNIVVYFLKRNNIYYPGKYKVTVEYNHQQRRDAFFEINPG